MSADYLIVDNKANKSLAKLPLKIQAKIIKSFKNIKQNPLAGAKLGGELSDYYKFRVGDYRVIYSFDSKVSQVTIARIEHRQGVYK